MEYRGLYVFPLTRNNKKYRTKLLSHSRSTKRRVQNRREITLFIGSSFRNRDYVNCSLCVKFNVGFTGIKRSESNFHFRDKTGGISMRHTFFFFFLFFFYYDYGNCDQKLIPPCNSKNLGNQIIKCICKIRGSSATEKFYRKNCTKNRPLFPTISQKKKKRKGESSAQQTLIKRKIPSFNPNIRRKFQHFRPFSSNDTRTIYNSK